MILKRCGICLAFLTASLGFPGSVAHAQNATKAVDASARPSVTSPVIQLADDRLTVNVTDVYLRELLEEIARQGGLTLVRHSSLHDRITIEFRQLPLDRALRRILRYRSFVLEYAEIDGEKSESAASRLVGLWVLASGEGNYPVQTTALKETKARPSQSAVALGSSVVHAALKSPDPEERADALETLGESTGPKAIVSLSHALGDEDVDVRQAAIDALAEIGGDEVAQIMAIALQDPDSAVRETAVEALRDIGGVTAIRLLQQASQDNDEFVRETAAESLIRMRNETHGDQTRN